MKLRNLILFLVLLVPLLFGITVCWAAECPVEVTFNHHKGIITITSVVDTVTIQDVKINRGNTEADIVIVKGQLVNLLGEKTKFPIALKFGDAAGIVGGSLFVPVTPKEVEVLTNLGSWKFKF